MINVSNFAANNLKIDKKSCKDIDTYYIAYVDKNLDWNANSVNPLYLTINKVHDYVSRGKYTKLLVNDKEGAVLKYNQVFVDIKHHIEKINENGVIYDFGFDKIKFSTYDNLPSGKFIYFSTMTDVIRCVFKQVGYYYPQVYLDDCLYQI